jgi:polyisoprenoid-binding protein YceI
VSRRLLPLWAILLLLVGASAAVAEPMTFRIDPGHSLIGFNVRHFFSRTPGRFKEYNGTIQLDEKNLAASSVEVTIQTASVDTENERRDGDLRSANFFHADSFPTITFKSTKVVPGPDKKFLIHGDLDMHGVTKPVTLDAELLGVGQVAMGGRPPRTIAGFEAKTTINRKDFGIVWNRVLDQGGTMLGDEVTITLQIEAVWQDPNAPRPEMGQRPAQTPPATPGDKK